MEVLSGRGQDRDLPPFNFNMLEKLFKETGGKNCSLELNIEKIKFWYNLLNGLKLKLTNFSKNTVYIYVNEKKNHSKALRRTKMFSSISWCRGMELLLVFFFPCRCQQGHKNQELSPTLRLRIYCISYSLPPYGVTDCVGMK